MLLLYYCVYCLYNINNKNKLSNTPFSIKNIVNDILKMYCKYVQ